MLKVYTYGDITEEEKKTFELVARRNALNDGYRQSQFVALNSLEELEEVL